MKIAILAASVALAVPAIAAAQAPAASPVTGTYDTASGGTVVLSVMKTF